MKKLQRNEKFSIFPAGILLLSIVLMFVVFPGILYDRTPHAIPKIAVTGFIIAIVIHLVLLTGYLRIIREARAGDNKRSGAYLGIVFLLMISGLAYMDGALSFMDHREIIYVPIIMITSTICDFAAAIMIITDYTSMPKTNVKYRLAGIPAWALSLMTLFTLILFLFIGEDPLASSLGTDQIISWIIYNIFLTVACFIICRAHPKSVWYTPIICNATGIIGLVANTIENIVSSDFGTTSIEWIFLISSIVLSFIGAIIGAMAGQGKINRQILQTRNIRFIEIVILLFFIISLFLPYGYGVKPFQYILGIETGHGQPPLDFEFMARITFPITLTFILLLLLIFQSWLDNQNLKAAKWIIIVILISYYIFALIDILHDWDSLFISADIFSLALSSFLFLVTLIMTRNNYLIIGNSILAIITIPVANVCATFLPEEMGGCALCSCFALLYLIALSILFIRQNKNQSSQKNTSG